MTTGPHYRPEDVARLARAGRVVATARVVSWLMNHDYDAAETLVEVLVGVARSGRHLGSTTLRNGEVADEYAVTFDQDDWYLKFYVDGDRVIVNVWSCCWDGTVH